MTLFRFRSLVWFCIGITSLLAAFSISSRAPWFQTAFFASFGLMALLTAKPPVRRIFRVGVRRSESGIECRYVPWFESVSYMVFVLFPMLAIAIYAGGSRPGAPAAYRWGAGAVLIAALVAMIYSMWMWRQCVLRLTPSSLTLRLPSMPSESIEIPREHIQSITPKTTRISYVPGYILVLMPGGRKSLNSLQVEIVYSTQGAADAAATVVIGPPPAKNGMQLTVKPLNLLNALLIWRESSGASQGELLHQVEGVLRGNGGPVDSSRTYEGYFSS